MNLESSGDEASSFGVSEKAVKSLEDHDTKLANFPAWFNLSDFRSSFSASFGQKINFLIQRFSSWI